MKAMVLIEQNQPLILQEIPIPIPKSDELLAEVEACGVCRTDLHILEGDLPLHQKPLILGHQIVGQVKQIGSDVQGWKVGDLVGIPWLASTCETCSYCLKSKENLCDKALFTGYHTQGGFAEYTICKAKYALALPSSTSATHLAPLLCAGLIGFRAYLATKGANTIGFYGFGSSAHILLQVAKEENKRIFVFTRKSDLKGKALAKKLGAFWVGDSEELSPELLEAVIVFAPAGELMVQALRVLQKGGICISAGIHMTDIPSFPYEDLFFEKILTCVSHLTRQDGKDFFRFIEKHPIETITHTYPLELANLALQDLKEGKKKGSFVLKIK
ncbi:MAG: zinc-dependent alcohol dehydrogenase family protein [Chlamydiota bacterium]